MSKNSKAYRAAAEKIDAGRIYSPLEAANLAKETSSKNYDATIDVAIRLGVDPRKADQLVRGTVSCRTAPVRPSALLFSPLARTQPRLKRPALTSSVPRN